MKNKWLYGIIILCIIVFTFLAYLIGLTQSSSELQYRKEKLKSTENQLQIVEKQYEELNKELKENEQQLEQNEREDTSKIEEQLKIINEKEQTIDKQEIEIEQLQEKINSLNTQLKELKDDIQAKHPKDENDKKVFLTFDDGPATLTNEILDILADHEVKATFFTIGKRMEQYPEIVNNTYENGHMVLPHSYSHDYAIYTTFDTFYKDFYKAEDVYKSILGFEAPPFFRFPGGSSNHSSFQYGGKQFMPNLTADVRDMGYQYIDWNVSSGDASPIANEPKKMLEQIKKGSRNKDLVVTLFHDVAPNKATAKILPDVIEFYKKNGYTFRTFRDITDDELQKMKSKGIANKTIIR